MDWQSLYDGLLKDITVTRWEVLLFVLGGVLVGLLIGLVEKKIRSCCSTKVNLPDSDTRRMDIVSWLTKVAQKPDPLGNLLKYGTLAKKGSIKEKIGPKVVRSFFKDLRQRGEIESIGEFNEIVPFDKAIHISLEKVSEGEMVQIISVGWRYRDAVIKKASVQKVKKNGA